MEVELEPGFRKGDMNNIPPVNSDMICDFISKAKPTEKDAHKDLYVDYVQVKKMADMWEAKALVLTAAGATTYPDLARVTLKVTAQQRGILESSCDQCENRDSCPHTLAFIFWLHRKSTDSATPAIGEFWGSESEALFEEGRFEALRIRDIFTCDELRLENDFEAGNIERSEGQAFLEEVLNEMEGIGLRDAALYNHCRPVFEEFEPLFIHHILLDTPNNGINIRSFIQHMEDQAKQGLFDRLAEVSKVSYKTPLWLEVQYMRLRCSLIHRIASRKDSSEDEEILDLLFCKHREQNVEERQQLKQHKRFILKQTEKLENKVYSECGLLLNESYPYICASPDGITDDHIVEIKAPKTDEEFEQYLEGRETIAPKYMAQIQIQMYMANVTKALYCVLSPTFDTNGALHYVWVQADMEFVASLLGAAEDFWKDIVFPRLAKIYLNDQ